MSGSAFVLPTTDIRHNAIQSKRDHDHKAKWAHGCRPGAAATVRPAVLLPKCKQDRRAHAYGVKRQCLTFKNPQSYFRLVSEEGLREASDSSDALSDQGPDLGSPTERIDVFYSFDARSGPRAGEHILSAALNKAVERFEIKETEKLVREYELIDDRESAESGYIADDDDYEFIDRASL
ncbi:predicted protein [Uncinocarpus reesii 1704]|uniref:Uncharacterized protein n=1 Tax=Uncinocarpus reesii (strain UAMH 1704) TaxID=336963 RepID=C4JXX7_UNCRE|nr:uncharacterized protein UREG_07028 [Uncinocarpus reesii 1704]EEP82163.1 predicted protein [Uncinocarpus reesii 1704]